MSTAAKVLIGRIANAKENRTSDFEAFLSDCDGLMKREYGVDYNEVAEMIHPHKEAALSAFDNGSAPIEFIASTAKEHGFKSLSEIARIGGDARNFNLLAAAISEFVGTKASAGWQRRQDGIVAFPLEDGFAVLHPIKEKDSTKYGFGITKQEGGVLSEDGYYVLNMGLRTDAWAAKEVEDVVERFHQDITPSFLAY